MSFSPYPSYQRHCGWSRPDDMIKAAPALRGDQEYDAVVIGAGYTGLAIVQRLAQLHPEYRIALLEAEQIGAGSPGRNSGFVLETVLGGVHTAHFNEIHALYQRTHKELMKQAALPTNRSGQTIFKAAATARGEKALQQLSKSLQTSKQPWQSMDAKQLQELTGSNYYRAGIRLSGNQLVNPVELVTAIARQLPDNVTLYEQSPAIELEQHQRSWTVCTPEGQLKAPQVFLANNAFIKGLGFGQSRSVTIYTYAGITAPLNDSEREQTSSKGQWGLLPAHRLGTTFRSTNDGRLMVRGMYDYETEGGNEVPDILQRSLSKRYPSLQGARQLEQWWGGTTSLTANGAPLWGQLKPGLFASVGCNGVGIVKGWLLGKTLAELAHGIATHNIPSLFGRPSWIPPEPFRKVGFLTVSAIEKKLAGNEC